MDSKKFRVSSLFLFAFALASASAVTGCDSSGSGTGPNLGTSPTISTGILPGTPPTTATAPTRSFSTDVLVFTGSGTWSTEIADAEALFTSKGASYQEATSAQLDSMSSADMAKFGVIFIPGGEGGTEAQSVSATTHANLRAAVQTLGVSYVGFCAGAFVAVAPAPVNGGDVSYGFGVVNGPVPSEYAGPGTSAAYESTLETFPNGTTENILWYGGPITPNTGVIAKYPTGDPAISEMWSGNGLVIIAGLHPDLSQSSLSSLGVSPNTSAQNLAWQIFSAALHQTPIVSIF